MKFKESNLEILNSVVGQTLRSQVLEDYTNPDLINILSNIEKCSNTFNDAGSELQLDEMLAALKSEAICQCDQDTVKDLKGRAQKHSTDCVNMSTNAVGLKIRGDVKTSCVGHAPEDCYIVLSPMILVMLKSDTASSNYKTMPTAFASDFMKLVGMLDDVDVYCNVLDSSGSVLVGTSNATYTFEYNNLSLL